MPPDFFFVVFYFTTHELRTVFTYLNGYNFNEYIDTCIIFSILPLSPHSQKYYLVPSWNKIQIPHNSLLYIPVPDIKII